PSQSQLLHHNDHHFPYTTLFRSKEAPNNANKDAWFVGYTPEYVTSMWMGYDYGLSAEDHYLTGGSAYPTQLTKKILTEINNISDLKSEFDKTDNVTAL